MVVAVVATMSLPATATAQILSPGKLGRAHSQLEGLSHCTECHDLGKKINGELCLKCHDGLKDLIAKGRGLHATTAVKDASCVSCHKEHRGTNAAIADWNGKTEKFDHSRSGWALEGKHAKAKCAACHTASYVTDKPLRERLAARAESTYLGLVRDCRLCHFDEHRDQLSGGCDTCHTAAGFSPAPRFDHDKSFVRRGAHSKLECESCHPKLADTEKRVGSLKPKNAETFVKYAIGQPKGCTACHRDVHAGKFGGRCQQCHDEVSWRRISGKAQDVTFHDKTQFPLKGLHRQADCGGCHPSKPGGGMKTRGLKFEQCSDCHVDAHMGQIAKDKTGVVPCQSCHDENGFFPSRYSLVEHQTSRYPLAGAHQAVACNGCHPADTEFFAEATVKPTKSGPVPRTQLLNYTRLRRPELDLARCGSCHRDPHVGQFASGDRAKGCETCHVVASFSELAFNHDKDSVFPLVGKHRGQKCEACHRQEANGDSVLYRGAPSRCASCHTDPHRGQFNSQAPDGSDCGACHGNDAFKPTTFSHTDATLTDFSLTGRHTAVACERCHIPVGVEGDRTAWYRGLPRRCRDCHEDVHAKQSGSALARVGGSQADRDCSDCHVTADWHQAIFDHEGTALPLRGRHRQVPCQSCHPKGMGAQVEPRCVSCHLDVHAGRLGRLCERCHDSTSFAEGSGVLAHGQTRFPLYGQHLMVPCDECHRDRSDRTFGGVPSRCETCHADAYARTAGSGLDHVAAGLSRDCRQCHNAVGWQRGRLPEHERCFPLARGNHRSISCLQCHTTLVGLQFDTCASFTAACTRCHRCSSMDAEHLGEEMVAGYQCADRKCYECHPNGAGD